jgi:RNA polymerase sporulation-specific sigma factor
MDENEKRLIIENKNLIYKIANIYRRQSDIEDLFQAGCIGLVKAYRKYDSTKNTKFTSYAYKYILGEISMSVINDRTIPVSKEKYALNKKIEDVKVILTQELERTPTTKEIAEYLDEDTRIIEDTINNFHPVESLDYEIDDNISLYSIIGNNMDIDAMIDLERELAKLDEEERKILLAQYVYDLSQEETAKMMNMNQVAVSRKKRKIITKMRQNCM